MNIKLMIRATLLTVTFASSTIADDFNTKLTTFINVAQKQLGSDYGIAVAVVKDDRIIYDNYFGYSNFAKKQRTQENDSFYIASSTKPLVALATLQLAKKGILDLDKSLQSYFPDVAFAEEVKADKINLRHLMNHTSGINNYAMVHATAYSGQHSPEQQIERLAASRSLKDAPFGTFQYTNLGYNILSLIIERETGKSWQDILQQEVFRPAGMTRSSAYMSASNRPGWNTPKTYSFRNHDKHAPLYLTKKDNTMHAAGGVIATATDLGKLVIAELNAGAISGEQVFPASLITESQQASAVQERTYKIYHRTGYGYGWNIGTLNDETLLHHFGGFAGTSAHVSFMPEHNVGIIILSNEDVLSPVINDLVASYAYDMLLGKNTADETAYNALSKWAGRLKGLVAMINTDFEKRAQRTWQLSHENTDYTGEYESKLAGKIIIEQTSDGDLKLTWGNMTAIAEPFTAAETVRVEFVPNNGSVVQFLLADSKVTGLTTDSFDFTRK